MVNSPANSNSSENEHPVWIVYDTFKEISLNVKYYSVKLHRVQSWNTGLEIFLGLATPSAGLAVADSVYWKTETIGEIWQFLVAIAALVAMVKPFLKFSEKIEKLKGITTDYIGLEHDLNVLILSIKERGKFEDDLKSIFWLAMEKLGRVKAQQIELKIDKSLQDKCYEEVNKENPMNSFFVPSK